VVKRNIVFHLRDPAGIAAKDDPFRNYVAVGTLENVRKTLISLVQEPPTQEAARE